MMGTGNSSWIIQVHAALERNAANDGPSQLLIWKVPSDLRTHNEHYEPKHWRCGLHHCPQSIHFDVFERFKVAIVRALQFTREEWDSFCKRVVFEPKEHWETMYCDSLHATSYSIEEIQCRLSLDALFLVVNLQSRGGGLETLGLELQNVMMSPALDFYYRSLNDDFYLVENQIPMELLERVVGILVTEYKDHVGEMEEWESEDWQVRNVAECVRWDYFVDPFIDATQEHEVIERRMTNLLPHANSYHGVHILDSTYRILCGKESLETIHEKHCPPICSATNLEACGVTIKGKEFTCFEDISFEKGCLIVPFLQIYDGTEKYFRNLVVHEALSRHERHWQFAANCYTDFMGGLMKTREDVILLEKQGIILVGVGSYDSVVDMWKHINHYIPRPYLTNNFFKMMTDINNYTKQRRYKYRFEFKKQFCSRPWIPLSYLAATIITIATLIQTYVAIIGSNGMKPHFAP